MFFFWLCSSEFQHITFTYIQFVSLGLTFFLNNCFSLFVRIFETEATPDDMWTPFKQLHRTVETCLSKRAPAGSLANLELTLQKHKSDFVNLLKNAVRFH